MDCWRISLAQWFHYYFNFAENSDSRGEKKGLKGGSKDKECHDALNEREEMMKNDWVMKTFTFQTAYLVWLLTDSLLFGGSRQGRRRLTRAVTGSMAAETEGARRAESRAFQQKLSTLCDWQIQEVQRRNTSVISSSRLEQRKKKIVDYHFKGTPTHTHSQSHTVTHSQML